VLNSFLDSMVMVQKRKAIVSPLDKADIILIILATPEVSPKANREKNRPNNWKIGAPGGCPTWSLKAVAIYSPQSQKEVVGSDVRI
jgi:hypothetical protein